MECVFKTTKINALQLGCIVSLLSLEHCWDKHSFERGIFLLNRSVETDNYERKIIFCSSQNHSWVGKVKLNLGSKISLDLSVLNSRLCKIYCLSFAVKIKHVCMNFGTCISVCQLDITLALLIIMISSWLLQTACI